MWASSDSLALPELGLAFDRVPIVGLAREQDIAQHGEGPGHLHRGLQSFDNYLLPLSGLTACPCDGRVQMCSRQNFNK